MKKKLTLADLAQLVDVSVTTETIVVQETKEAGWGKPLTPIAGMKAWIVVPDRAYRNEQGEQASATQPGFVVIDKFVEQYVFSSFNCFWQKHGLLYPIHSAYATEGEALRVLEHLPPHVTVRESNPGRTEGDCWRSDGSGWMGNRHG